MYKLSHSHFSIAANFEGDRSGFFLGGQKDSLDIFKGGGQMPHETLPVYRQVPL